MRTLRCSSRRPRTSSRSAAWRSPARAPTSSSTIPSAGATSGTDGARAQTPDSPATASGEPRRALPRRRLHLPRRRVPAEQHLRATDRGRPRDRRRLRQPRSRARADLPRDRSDQLRAGRDCNGMRVHHVPARPVGVLVLGGVLHDASDRASARHGHPGHAHTAGAAPLRDRGRDRHGRPLHPHRRAGRMEMVRRHQVPAVAFRQPHLPRRQRCDRAPGHWHDPHHPLDGRPPVGAVPVHEARARHARSSPAARGGGTCRRARRLDARDRLGPRGPARRGCRPHGGAVPVRPPAHPDAANPAVRLRSRRPRRAGEPGRRRHRRRPDRHLPQPRRPIRPLRHFRAPAAFRLRRALGRAAREADRLVRAAEGAEGMRPTIAALAATAAMAAVLALLPFALSGYHQALAAQVATFFVAILGLNILTGYTGQISIGHGAFMAIGGYTTAILSRDHHTSLILTMLVAFGICFFCGLLVGLPALRLSGVYLALATFALAVSVPQIPLKFSTYLGGSGGVQAAKTVSHLWLYAVSWSTAAVLFVVAW